MVKSVEEQVKDLQMYMDENKKVFDGCHGVENERISIYSKVFMSNQCIQRQTDINFECLICKISMNRVKWADLPTALTMH